MPTNPFTGQIEGEDTLETLFATPIDNHEVEKRYQKLAQLDAPAEAGALPPGKMIERSHDNDPPQSHIGGFLQKLEAVIGEPQNDVIGEPQEAVVIKPQGAPASAQGPTESRHTNVLVLSAFVFLMEQIELEIERALRSGSDAFRARDLTTAQYCCTRASALADLKQELETLNCTWVRLVSRSENGNENAENGENDRRHSVNTILPATVTAL